MQEEIAIENEENDDYAKTVSDTIYNYPHLDIQGEQYDNSLIDCPAMYKYIMIYR